MNNVDPSNFTSSEQIKGVLKMYQMLNEPVPQELLDRLEELKRQESVAQAVQPQSIVTTDDDFVDSETPIYDTLVKHAKFKPSDEQRKCIFDTVDYLLKTGKDAEQPGLLLGRIQCGKTDTFVKIMALAMDRKIDVCIVLTKGTNALADQTVSRMNDDFKPFAWTDRRTRRPIVSIYDIMKIKDNGINTADVNRQKIIIICKKEDDNLRHLLKLFNEKQPLLKKKNILIVDDEADFASWNYMINGGQVNLAVITSLINDFVHTPTYCRYLQVTATPYSLYLQPDQTIEVGADGYVRPMRPRFTTIVPTHPGYVGGDHFFVKSVEDPESLYGHLFHPISDKCMKVMKDKNQRYLSNMLTSKNISDFRYAIFSYLMATIVRKIQEADTLEYRSSCLIHLEVSQKKQVWQEELVLNYIERIKVAYTSGNTEYFDELFDAIYDDLSHSVKAARDHDHLITCKMPSKKDVCKELKASLKELKATEIVHVVNSDRGVKELLNSNTGQLKLTAIFNIFIGGSILDRGITIDRMLCFFYGRTPSKFQQDTVLQHMRLYGARASADMAVTRLHTTNGLYEVLVKMNDLDNQLREFLINNDNDPEKKAVFIGVDSESKIVPCAKGKIIVSDTVSITPGFRNTVWGFQTGSKSEISRTISDIDAQLESLLGYCEDEFFAVEKRVVFDILKKIRSTFIYDKKADGPLGNFKLDWNVADMIGCIEYTTGADSDLMYLMVRKNMNASRIRENGKFMDAPDTGSTDLFKAREVAKTAPALMLFRQNGKNEQGWRDTPFYWPVLVAPKKIKPAIFTAGGDVPKIYVINVDTTELTKDIDPNNILTMPNYIDKVRYDDILCGNSEQYKCTIGELNASRLLELDVTGRHLRINSEVAKPDSIDAGVHTYNNGKFPFVVRDYKYILLRSRANGCIMYVLCQLDPKKPYEIEAIDDADDDTLVFPSGKEIDVQYTNRVNWTLKYNIKVLRSKEFKGDF
ncbi:MAG: hypothetical protein HUJ96_03760 [Marinilabiliaceae bacterium]|nr:hypothetical protein [Marinilabiliaceae bacterium]